jgi:hypothetical protein
MPIRALNARFLNVDGNLTGSIKLSCEEIIMYSITKNKVAYLLIFFFALWAFNAQAMFLVKDFSKKRSAPLRAPRILHTPNYKSKNHYTHSKVSMNKALAVGTLAGAAFILAQEPEAGLSEEENTKLLESKGTEFAKELLAIHQDNQTVRTRLFEWAFIRGKTQFAWEVFELGIDVNSPSNYPGHPTLLDLTLMRADLDFPKALLEKGADPNVMSPMGSGQQPLICKYVTEPKKIQLLTKYGADVNQKDTFGRFALWYIFPYFGSALDQFGRSDSLDFLYDKGLNVHDTDLPLVAGMDILEDFKRQGLWRLIDQVKAAGNSVPASVLNVSNDEKIAIDFWHAIRTGDAIKVNQMIDRYKINAHSLNEFYDLKRPWLTEAAAKGHVEVIKVLLKRGADPDDALGTKQYALIEAVEKGEVEAAELLLLSGANPYVCDAHKRSVLFLAQVIKNDKMEQLLTPYFTNRAFPADIFSFISMKSLS